MADLPHRYLLEARAATEGSVALTSPGLPALEGAPPPQFDGPGDIWSPEALLLAALSSCFVLAFRVLAGNSKLLWSDLQCRTEGLVDRGDGGMHFSEIQLQAQLTVAAGQNLERARRLLERAEKICPVSASLAVPVHLDTQIDEERA
jgi:organic hydroperoxide reductase OsmC/OhrA